jgi:zinc finger FYVE domain-containing protein 26
MLQGRMLQRQASTQPLPHSWYTVDLQLEFSKFSCLQHFLEQRLVPFAEYDMSTSGDDDDDDEQKAPSSKSLLQSLTSRLQMGKSPPKEVSSDFTVDRRVALLPTSHPLLYQVCREVLLHVMKTKKPSDVLELMKSEAYTAVSLHPAMRGLRDVAARMAFTQLARSMHSSGRSDQQSLLETVCSQEYEAVKYLSSISDVKMSSQLLMSTLDSWSVESNIEMLTYCLAHLPPPSLLHPLLSGTLETMRVYLQILELVNPSYALSASTQSSQSVVSPIGSPFSVITYDAMMTPKWTLWQEVREATRSDPDQVLDLLVKRGCYDLARRWARTHKLEHSTLKKIEVLFLLNVLHGGQTHYLPIYQSLERFPDVKDQIKMCEDVLFQLHEASTATSVADIVGEPILLYLVYKLSHALDKEKLSNYRNRAMGVKILKCIPETSRGDFQPLLAEPMYILEQLLMDSKLDWVGEAVAVLRSDLSLFGEEMKDGPGNEHLSYPGLASDPLDLTLTFYAVKSLDIPLSDMGSSTPRSPASQAQTPVPGTPIHPGSLPISRAHRRTSSNQSQVDPAGPISLKRTQEGIWQPPHNIPKQKDWVRDSEAEKCMACKKVIFGTFHRRHHCRRCGEVVCARCSGYSLQLESYSSRQRVCFRCNIYETKDTYQEDQEPDSHIPLSFPPSSALAHQQQWQLIPKDPTANQKTRTNFYYEQSPSTELFLSIVEFHSSPGSCAYFIMDRVDKLSLRIISDSSGQLHKEIDYGFVIGLMKQLILNAKLKFAQSGDSSGVELCDT